MITIPLGSIGAVVRSGRRAAIRTRERRDSGRRHLA